MRRTAGITLAVAVATAGPLAADLFRVGPGGTHATIQSAVEAARATPGGDTVRVAAGTWTERVEIFDEPGLPVGLLRLSGGWRAPGYIERDADPAATIVTASGAGRPLYVDCDGADVVIEGFTFRDGRVDESDPLGQVGGGVLLSARNGCELTLTRSAIVDNRAGETIGSPSVGSVGAGLAAAVFEGGSLVVADNRFEGNQLTSVDAAVGGGAHFSVGSDATLSVTGNRFVANRVTAADHANASGVAIELYGSRSRGDISDNQVLDGVVEGPNTTAGAASFSASSGVGNRMTLRRNRYQRNAGGGGGLASQVWVWASGDSEIVTSDSLIANSSTQGGIALGVEAGGGIVATNLTVAGNVGGRGIDAWVVDGGSVEIWSSISFGNGTNDSFGPGTERHSHFTADPRFADAARGDFHLRLDSPAIDAGLPGVPGGLGPADLDLGPRVRGAAVDIGAYEHRSASASCEVRRFGTLPFVDGFAPVCACLRDDGLRTSRCGGFGLPMFFDVVVPPPPGPFGEAEVRIRPWELGSGDYQLAAQLLHASKVDPVEIVGPKSGKFHPGKELKVRLRYLTPGTTATLRLAMRYRLDGEPQLRETWLDVRIDPDDPQP